MKLEIVITVDFIVVLVKIEELEEDAVDGLRLDSFILVHLTPPSSLSAKVTENNICLPIPHCYHTLSP